ncbi:capsular polysaccharide export protein, LipB/KpsS family [Oryzifoliimicrobium ureilyticus]|uniref:capsular polysaccharide export protein, LipB/KpsS family n=1 Tax=Oryzifoliimicrobium ureilyticus TaxID=3113724 RepID=UPI003076124A
MPGRLIVHEQTIAVGMLEKTRQSERIGQKDWYPPRGMRLGATHFLRSDFPWLHHYLDLPELSSTLAPGIGGTVSWGGRIAAKLGEAVGRLRGLPHWHMEDGFLRSVALGKAGSVPLSIVMDDLGLSTKAAAGSRLERLIIEADENDAEKGRQARDAIVSHRLSKYNHLPHKEPFLPPAGGRRRILLVDQVKGDVSVPFSMGSEQSFQQMLTDAIATKAQCVVRTHPDVVAGYRKGYMTELAARHSDIVLSSEAISADAMIAACDEVWTVASQFGFDALLRGKPVRCYAAPFYAGWGLTTDMMTQNARTTILARRTAPRSIDHLAAAAYLEYPLYRNPKDWRQVSFFEAVELILAGQSSN